MTQIARSAACNRLHTIEQRAGRWILQTHDRVGSDSFLLVRTFLAQMLGEEAEAVGAATARLVETDVIVYEGDVLTVLDRARLERASCDCYGVVRDEYERLLSF